MRTAPLARRPLLTTGAVGARQVRWRREERLWTILSVWRKAWRHPRMMGCGVALLLLVSAGLHLEVIATSKGASYDIQSYAIQAATVLQHQNVYDVTTRYPYPPVWIWVVALMHLLSTATRLPFDQVVRLPAAVGDMALIVALYSAARRRWGSSLRALLPAALFGLNPLTLLISAGHGQFDALDLVFVLLAVAPSGGGPSGRVGAEVGAQRRDSLWRAAALGAAIALKGYPILFAPTVVLSAPRGRRFLSALVVVLPLVASVALYSLIFGYSSQMLPHILQYPSTYDAGWGFVLRTVDPTISVLMLAQLSTIAKSTLIFVALMTPLAVPLLASRQMASRSGRALAREVTLIFAVFYATTVAMSVQYLLWILPFLCLIAPWWVIPYTSAALAAVVTFYLRLFAGALPATSIWNTLLAPFSAHRTVGVASVIAVSALLALALLMQQAVTALAPQDGRSPSLDDVAPSNDRLLPELHAD